MTIALPPRPADGHKGTFGTVLVVGGCDDEVGVMLGGPAFAALGALRSGAGRCVLAMPRSILAEALSVSPSATGLPLATDAGEAMTQLQEAGASMQAEVIGPGLGQSPWAASILEARLAGPGPPVVLDADGLNLLAQDAGVLRSSKRDMILTPHPGEYARLAEALGLPAAEQDDASRREAAETLATESGAVVVLKGARTIVTDGSRTWICDVGSAVLATAGTGDVLAGLIGGFKAQSAECECFESAVLGTWVHACAGERWAASHADRGLLAAELAEAVPGVLEACRRGDLDLPRCPS